MQKFTAHYAGKGISTVIEAHDAADALHKALDFFKLRGKKSAWMVTVKPA